jgi:hypothetical protein
MSVTGIPVSVSATPYATARATLKSLITAMLTPGTLYLFQQLLHQRGVRNAAGNRDASDATRNDMEWLRQQPIDSENDFVTRQVAHQRDPWKSPGPPGKRFGTTRSPHGLYQRRSKMGRPALGTEIFQIDEADAVVDEFRQNPAEALSRFFPRQLQTPVKILKWLFLPGPSGRQTVFAKLVLKFATTERR